MTSTSEIFAVIITIVVSAEVNKGNPAMTHQDPTRQWLYNLGQNKTVLQYRSHNLLSETVEKTTEKALPQNKSELLFAALTESIRSSQSKNATIPEENQALKTSLGQIRQKRQVKTKSYMDGDTLVECFGKVYAFQAPLATDYCNRTKLSKPMDESNKSIPGASSGRLGGSSSERKFSAMLVTVIFTVSSTGRKYVQDVVLADKQMVMDDLNKAKKKLKSDELAPLQDLTKPSVTYIKYKSESYTKVFSYDSFVYEEWCKVHLVTAKGSKEATELSKDYSGMNWEIPLKDTEAGLLQMIKVTWGGENPLFTLISILFPTTGEEPRVMVQDGFSEGKPTTAPVSTLIKIMRSVNMVSVKEFSASNKVSSKLELSTYTFVYNSASVGPSMEVTFFCAFNPDHSSCSDSSGNNTAGLSNLIESANTAIPSSPSAERRPRPEAAFLVTIIYVEDPDGRKRAVDIVFKNKQEILSELKGSINQTKPEDLEILKDLTGPSTAHVKLNTEPYKLIFGSDKFQYLPWLEAFKLSTVGPVVSSALSPDFCGVDMRETVRDNGKSGTLHLIQLYWGWDTPLYTLVSAAYPKPSGEPQVTLMDVFGDGKQKQVTDTLRFKNILQPNKVSIRDITPTPSISASKVNIDLYGFDPKPNLVGPPRESTFTCAFTPTQKSCGASPPAPAPTVSPTPKATTVQPESSSQPPPLLITIVYDLDPSTGRRFVSDVVFKNKKEVIDELGAAKATLNPTSAKILNDPSGTSTTYVRLNSPPYTKMFAGNTFSFDAWAGHFQNTRSPPLSTALFFKDLTDIQMKEVVKVGGSLVIQRFLLHWQGDPRKPDADRRYPVYTMVDVYYPQVVEREPRVNVTDVYDASVQAPPTQYIVRTKIIRRYSVVVTVIETTVVTTVTTKISILTYIYDLPDDTLHPVAQSTSFQHGFTAPVFTVKHVSTQSTVQTNASTSQSSFNVTHTATGIPAANNGTLASLPTSYSGSVSTSHTNSSTSTSSKQKSSTTSILGMIPDLVQRVLAPVNKIFGTLGFRATKIFGRGAVPYAASSNESVFAAAVMPSVADYSEGGAVDVGRKESKDLLARNVTVTVDKPEEKSPKGVAPAGRSAAEPNKMA